jgi:hypothetical protein
MTTLEPDIPYALPLPQQIWLIQIVRDFLSLILGRVAHGQRFRAFVAFAFLALSTFMLIYPLFVFGYALSTQVLLISPPLAAMFAGGAAGIVLCFRRLPPE